MATHEPYMAVSPPRECQMTVPDYNYQSIAQPEAFAAGLPTPLSVCKLVALFKYSRISETKSRFRANIVQLIIREATSRQKRPLQTFSPCQLLESSRTLDSTFLLSIRSSLSCLRVRTAAQAHSVQTNKNWFGLAHPSVRSVEQRPSMSRNIPSGIRLHSHLCTHLVLVIDILPLHPSRKSRHPSRDAHIPCLFPIYLQRKS